MRDLRFSTSPRSTTRRVPLQPRAHQPAPSRSWVLPTAARNSCDSVGRSSPKSTTRPAVRAASSTSRGSVPGGMARRRSSASSLTTVTSGKRRSQSRSGRLHVQPELPAARGGAQRRYLALQHCPAPVDHDDVLAEVLHEVELVAGEQHGAAFPGPLPQAFRTGSPRPPGRVRRTARRARSPRVVNKCGGQLQPLLHAHRRACPFGHPTGRPMPNSSSSARARCVASWRDRPCSRPK